MSDSATTISPACPLLELRSAVASPEAEPDEPTEAVDGEDFFESAAFDRDFADPASDEEADFALESASAPDDVDPDGALEDFAAELVDFDPEPDDFGLDLEADLFDPDLEPDPFDPDLEPDAFVLDLEPDAFVSAGPESGDGLLPDLLPLDVDLALPERSEAACSDLLLLDVRSEFLESEAISQSGIFTDQGNKDGVGDRWRGYADRNDGGAVNARVQVHVIGRRSSASFTIPI